MSFYLITAIPSKDKGIKYAVRTKNRKLAMEKYERLVDNALFYLDANKALVTLSFNGEVQIQQAFVSRNN